MLVYSSKRRVRIIQQVYVAAFEGSCEDGASSRSYIVQSCIAAVSANISLAS